VLLGTAYVYARDYVRRHPQDFPWTRLDLRHPTGALTGPKLARLGSNTSLCRALLRDAGADDVAVPPRSGGPSCGYRDGMRLGSRPIDFRPAGPVTSCSVAAGLFLLETRIIQPAAVRHLGSRVTAIDHAGSYSCRRLYGRSEGAYSEHATADAIDVLGFRFADGRRVSVLRDWNGDTSKAEFLREVRDGSCRLFSTVLSPDYNAAHADHLHLDQAERGSFGWRACS
jgi:hypothetical protein